MVDRQDTSANPTRIVPSARSLERNAKEGSAGSSYSDAPGKNCGRLVLTHLTKQYANSAAVADISIDVTSGEFLTLLGPSGSGKTTTLMMIAGFANPSHGDICLDGKSIIGLPPEKRNIGVVFQDYALFPHMSVFENIAFPLRMRRVGKHAIESRVLWALGLVRLTGFEQRLPRQLSGGQQQRVAFARALVFRPGILLMDEPLGALDKNLREQMQLELMRLHKEIGVTIVYVTHDQREALTMSDRIALMNDGRIEQIGTAQELYEQPKSRFVAEFIGESNIVVGDLKPGPEPGGLYFVCDAGLKLLVPGDLQGAQSTKSRLLVLRPEKLRILPFHSAQENANFGVIEEIIYIGDQTRYRARVGDELLLTVVCNNVQSAYRPVAGDTVVISCDPQDMCLLAA